MIIKFLKQEKKFELMKKIKTFKLDVSAFGRLMAIRIFCNKHHSRNNQVLFQKSWELWDYCFKFIWTRNGNIFVWETESAPIIKILDEYQIEEIKKNNTRLNLVSQNGKIEWLACIKPLMLQFLTKTITTLPHWEKRLGVYPAQIVGTTELLDNSPGFMSIFLKSWVENSLLLQVFLTFQGNYCKTLVTFTEL